MRSACGGRLHGRPCPEPVNVTLPDGSTYCTEHNGERLDRLEAEALAKLARGESLPTHRPYEISRSVLWPALGRLIAEAGA